MNKSVFQWVWLVNHLSLAPLYLGKEEEAADQLILTAFPVQDKVTKGFVCILMGFHSICVTKKLLLKYKHTKVFLYLKNHRLRSMNKVSRIFWYYTSSFSLRMNTIWFKEQKAVFFLILKKTPWVLIIDFSSTQRQIAFMS